MHSVGFHLLSNAFWASIFLLIAALSIHYIYLIPTITSDLEIYDAILPVAKAKRAIIVVSDGLRADIAYREQVMPNLARRIKETSNIICCTSIANAPTESRPAHIAMLGGVSGDISNIYSGFRDNVAKFDHILRRASKGFAFGEHTVVGNFEGPNVSITAFPSVSHHGQDDPTNYDIWTLEKYQELFRTAQQDHSLATHLKGEGVVILLHLAGVDTAGHQNGALSPEYSQTARAVDIILNKIEQVTREYFNDDDQTLFVFTSDHGFPDVGSHGGNDISTRTCPFVAWGSKAIPHDQKDFHKKIKQLEISPFIAAHVGLATPANSMATFPRALLGGSEEDQARAMVASYGQLLNAFKGQCQRLNAKNIVFRPVLRAMEGMASAQFNKLITNLTVSKDIIRQLEKGIEQTLWMDAVMRKFERLIAAGPLFLVCLAIFLEAQGEMDKVKRTWKNTILQASIALVVGMAWFWLVFHEWFLSMLIGWTVWKFQRIVYNTNYSNNDIKQVVTSAVLNGLLLWSGKSLILVGVLAALILYQRKAKKSDGLTIALLGVILGAFSFEPTPLLRKISCLFGITWLTTKVFALMSRDSPKLYSLTGMMTLLMGFHLKLLLLLENYVPYLAPFYCAIVIMIAGIMVFIKRNESKWQSMVQVIFILISTIIVDWRLTLTNLAVIYYVLLLQQCLKGLEMDNLIPGKKVVNIDISSGVLITCLCLIFLGPQTLSWFIFNQGYAHSSFTRTFSLQLVWEWPLTAMLGLFQLRLAWESFINLDKLVPIAIRSAPITVLIMILLVPGAESWLEFGSAIAKVFTSAASPILITMTSIVLGRYYYHHSSYSLYPHHHTPGSFTQGPESIL